MVGSGSLYSLARLSGPALSIASMNVVTEQRHEVSTPQSLNAAKSRVSYVLAGPSVCSAIAGPLSKEVS